MSWAPFQGAVVADRYELVSRVGAGGMATVWQAKQRPSQGDVALKFLAAGGAEPMAVERFEREARVCARLASPHIVRVFDFGIHYETPFLVMELLEGEDLAALLARRRLSLPQCAALGVQIGAALEVAHAAGVIHRDLKPSNVFMVRGEGEPLVKLVDFGIARDLTTSIELTRTGACIGSPRHMSPEQVQGMVLDERTDLWSLGVVLYQAITGLHVAPGRTTAEIAMQILAAPIRPPTQVIPELPELLDRWFSKALARDRERRFQTASEMTASLVAIVEGRDAAPWLSERRGRSAATLSEADLPEAALVSGDVLAATVVATAPMMVAPLALAPSTKAPPTMAPRRFRARAVVGGLVAAGALAGGLWASAGGASRPADGAAAEQARPLDGTPPSPIAGAGGAAAEARGSTTTPAESSDAAATAASSTEDAAERALARRPLVEEPAASATDAASRTERTRPPRRGTRRDASRAPRRPPAKPDVDPFTGLRVKP
ncbi:MAG: protein kinase [Kofleriaceae bacterium]